jgi:threonine dehydrogenase-like Zn-dependent dehydrogenase
MRGVVMYAPGDVRVEDVDEPKILKPTDAIIRLSSTSTAAPPRCAASCPN